MIEEHRNPRSLLAINLTLGANIFLAVLKTTIGILGHSPALLADGVNSTSDVAYNVVVWVFMRLSRKPADHEHPFGHSQLESIAALTVGAFVITTAVTIFWEAVNTIFDYATGQTQPVQAGAATFYVALLTVGLKYVLFVYTSRIGKQAHNPAVQALAYDHRNDIFSAIAVLIGISFGRAGYAWLDPLAGAIVALVILRTGVQILRESASDLMDTVPGQNLEQQVREILGEVPGVCKLEDIRAHRFGPYLTMNITLCVDGSISVSQGDQIATLTEEKLRSAIQFLEVVHIHYHPA